jgi:hypothetical protein
MHFDDYQQRTRSADRTSREPWIGLAQSTFGLTEKVGAISACMKKRLRGGYGHIDFLDDVKDRLGDALWYFTSVCSHLHMSLEEIAARNLIVTEARWLKPDETQQLLFGRLFDLDFPEHEQLPRRFRVKFVEDNSHQRSWLTMVEVWVGDEPLGDPIDDNSPGADHYRLHDILHLANAAILGWSPVIRKLLRRKRKSNPTVDKYEDGARACDTEEALASLIHNEAKRNSYFESSTVVDTPLLIKLRSLAADLEVNVRSAAEWQHCILEAYRVFRSVRDHNGGVVEVSLLDRTISFVSPTTTQDI